MNVVLERFRDLVVKIPNCICCMLLLVCFVTSLSAQRFADIVVEPIQVKEHIYMLKGAGGNVGLCFGKDGVLIIDSQYSEMSAKLISAIQALTDQPVRFLVNTHWHGDHTGGNTNFNKEGSTIIAHQQVRHRLSQDQFIQAFGRKVLAADRSAWPEITFEDDFNLHLNGENIMIFHVDNAHTDGDAIVYFAQSNVMHMGDTYFKGRYPFIDISSGGSIQGIIDASEKVLFLCNEDTVIIPGHGALSNKEELSAYRQMLISLKSRMEKVIAEGKSLEEIQEMSITADLDDTWGTGFIKPAKIVDIIWTDLTRQSN